MKLELKNYKYYKIKQYLKTQKIFFICTSLDLNYKNWLILQQKFFKVNLKYYKLNNSLTIKFLKHSIFKNIIPLINGPIFLININKNQNLDHTLSQLKSFNAYITLLSLKLNNKIYFINQLSTLQTLNYKKNIKVFHKTLKSFFKQPYNKIRN